MITAIVHYLEIVGMLLRIAEILRKMPIVSSFYRTMRPTSDNKHFFLKCGALGLTGGHALVAFMVNFEVENEREQRKMGLMRTLTRNDPESSLESIKEKRKGYDIPEEISISEFFSFLLIKNEGKELLDSLGQLNPLTWTGHVFGRGHELMRRHRAGTEKRGILPSSFCDQSAASSSGFLNAVLCKRI
ncbi:Oidioi.mRNA.OKI2018_I69.XSR.g14253.t1.cds [Oikopleura dioica]|uniref:Oidioi.mRNA.OKI2018_I69.XSR.g14253.t1.cds n=1 Tax=Oikopleura dioica TaxID=34765 RepID=A0ABN7SD60_OIKDI|nr:Oidioi.mRNA.OKI2018_I69.XSR.g14253.t1.cds [Oikopleura dioica]